MLTQTPPHSLRFALLPQFAVHTPATHCCPGTHIVPHAPQLAFAVWRLVQPAPAQILSPLMHVALHAPFWHTCPSGQALRHCPQLSLSVLVSA
jgi:hypothetical protein